MKKRILFLLVCLANVAQAQDMHLSMYDASPLFTNPAMTGVVDADFRLHVQYRTQWKSVNFKPYNSMLASFDMPFKKSKWSLGVQISNFRAGSGNFNVLQGLLSTSYNTALDKKKNHGFSFGVQGGVTQKSLEYQLLSFNNQYSFYNGGYFDATAPSNENFGAESSLRPTVNAGVMYYYAKQQARFNPFIGFSAFNLLNTKETFFDQENRLPMRYYLHFGSRINFTETLYLIPKVFMSMQRNLFETTVAAEFGYYLKGSDIHILLGAIHRVNDAMVVTGGLRMSNFILKLGYDVNLSRLSTVSNGRGGFEISLTYLHKKSEKVNEKICPRL